MTVPFGTHALFTIVRLLHVELAIFIKTEKPSLDIFVDLAKSKGLSVDGESLCWRH